MLLEKTEGCVCWGRYVDDKSLEELSEEEKNNLLQVLKDQLTLSDLDEIFDLVLDNHYTDYESDDKPCECCGDYVCTWKLEIKNLGN